MRQVILDTETTGLYPKKGDRIVEVGCVEMIDRKLTGRHLHFYINPERDIPEEVVKVHGIDNEKVKDCPTFRDLATDIWTWLEGAELVIHNSAFDMGFLNAEFERYAQENNELFKPLESVCTVLDTLKMAREKHPGAKASLDALCKRYGIDNSHRDLHGALLDAEILAEVYLMLTGGQTALLLDDNDADTEETVDVTSLDLTASNAPLITVQLSPEEKRAHEDFLAMLEKASGKNIEWHY